MLSSTKLQTPIDFHPYFIYRAEEFASQGCKVYATSRNISKIDDFPENKVEKLALDVNSEESIAKALEYVTEKEGRIDILVNNAGVTAPGAFFFVY